MKKRLLLCFVIILMSCMTAAAQQAQMQPLTFWYAYAVNPGKEEQFLELVKSVGAPVRDKLMAEGVILAWGVESSMLRMPGDTTHEIWYTVADYAGLEKVDTAIRAQIAKLTEEAAKAGTTKKGAAPALAPMARMGEVADLSKTRDYLTRDIIFAAGSTMPPEGSLPYARYAFVKVKPGKAAEYRKAWEKYNKPVYDRLKAKYDPQRVCKDLYAKTVLRE